MERCKLKTQTKSVYRKNWSKKTNTTTSHSSLETSLKNIEPTWVLNSKMIFKASWITKRRILLPLQHKDLILERLKKLLNLMLEAWRASMKQEATNQTTDQELSNNYLIPSMSSQKKTSEFSKITTRSRVLLWKKLFLDMKKVFKKITLLWALN